jgi:hypothetical protein
VDQSISISVYASKTPYISQICPVLLARKDCVLVAPGEGAVMAEPEGATLPTVHGSAWGVKRAGEVEDVQRLAGHSDSRSTSIYDRRGRKIT